MQILHLVERCARRVSHPNIYDRSHRVYLLARRVFFLSGCVDRPLCSHMVEYRFLRRLASQVQSARSAITAFLCSRPRIAITLTALLREDS